MDSGTDTVSVVPLVPGQEGAAAAAFVASHADYPAFRAVFPDGRRRRRALLPFFTATVRDAIHTGVVDAVFDGTTVVGAAAWLPPRRSNWSLRRQATAVPAFLKVLAACPSRFTTLLRYGMAAQRAHPPGDYWYLVALGVRPDGRRSGLGTALLTPMLDRADREEVPCYLETSDPANVTFYERLGFRTVTDGLALVPGGPTHLAMRREVSPR